MCRAEPTRYTYARGRWTGLLQPGCCVQHCGQGSQGADAAAVIDLRGLENARLDALQLPLWDAAMTGDIKAVVAVV